MPRLREQRPLKVIIIMNLDADMYFSENFKGFEEKVIALGEQP